MKLNWELGAARTHPDVLNRTQSILRLGPLLQTPCQVPHKKDLKKSCRKLLRFHDQIGSELVAADEDAGE